METLQLTSGLASTGDTILVQPTFTDSQGVTVSDTTSVLVEDAVPTVSNVQISSVDGNYYG